MRKLWKIGFNPNDQRMLWIGTELIVLTETGDVFGAQVLSGQMYPVVAYGGPKIGFNLQDRFVVALPPTSGELLGTILVVTTSGEIFASDVSVNHELQPVFQFKGDVRIGFNPQDRFMTVLGKTLVVITATGLVFGANVLGTGTNRYLSPIFQFSGAAIGFNPQDQAVVAVGNKLVVLTSDGTAWASRVTSKPGPSKGIYPDGTPMGETREYHLDQPKPFEGGVKIGYNTWDKFWLAVGAPGSVNATTLIVVTNDGNVFGADVVGDSLRPVTQLNVPIPSVDLTTNPGPELKVFGSDFTPDRRVDVTIQNLPGEPLEIKHSPTANETGEFLLFEKSLIRPHVSSGAIVPDIFATARDETNGRVATAATPAGPYIQRDQ